MKRTVKPKQRPARIPAALSRQPKEPPNCVEKVIPQNAEHLSRVDRVSAVGVIQDATERKRAQRVLQESERLLCALVEKSFDAITLLDANGTMILTLPAIQPILGYPLSEMVGRNAFELVHPDDRPGVLALFAQLVRTPGNSVTTQFRLRPQDGAWRWVEVAVTNLLEETSVRAIVVNLRDITERKRAEEALRTSESQLSNAMKLARLGHWEYDVATDRFTFNDHFYTMLRTTVEQVGGYTMSSADYARRFVHPDEMGAVGEEIQKAIETTDPQFSRQLEHRIIYGDGKIGHITVLYFVVKDSQGRTVKTYGVNQDITERKRVEEAIQRRNEELTTLNRIGQALSRLGEPSEILELVFTMVGRVLDHRNLYIALYDEANRHIAFPVYTIDGERRTAPSRPFGNGLTEYVIHTRAPLLLPDRVAERITELGLAGIGTPARCFLAVPMLAGEKVIGIIAIQDYERENVYDASQAELLGTLAAQAAIALENARLYSAVQQELDERRRAEEALQESEEKYRNLVERANDGIVIVQDGVVKYVNPRASEIRGGNIQEVIGTPFANHIYPDELAKVAERYKRRLAGEDLPSTYEIGLRRSDDSKVYVELNAGLITYQGKPADLVIVRDITERKQRERELESIATMSAVLRTAPTRSQMLPVILDQVLDLLDVQGATLAIRNLATDELSTELGRGKWANFTGVQLSPDKSLSGHVIATGQPYVTTDVKQNPLLARPDLIGDLNCVACVPLTIQDQTIGALWVGRRTAIREEEVHLLVSIADIAANAIRRATLYEQTQKYAADLALAYDTTLEGWAHALELRDQETEGHSRRVMQMTLDLARAMGIGGDEMENIRRGVRLHDVGKMGIPDSVLLKPGTPNEREWEIMKRHPEYAYNLLAPIDYLRKAIDIPYCHHEKWDGTGYPRGLKAEAIPLAARIFAVVDVWDALTSDRPYRKAWTRRKALEYIREQSGKHFDPRVVDKFLREIAGE